MKLLLFALIYFYFIFLKKIYKKNIDIKKKIIKFFNRKTN